MIFRVGGFSSSKKPGLSGSSMLVIPPSILHRHMMYFSPVTSRMNEMACPRPHIANLSDWVCKRSMVSLHTVGLRSETLLVMIIANVPMKHNINAIEIRGILLDHMPYSMASVHYSAYCSRHDIHLNSRIVRFFQWEKIEKNTKKSNVIVLN